MHINATAQANESVKFSVNGMSIECLSNPDPFFSCKKHQIPNYLLLHFVRVMPVPYGPKSFQVRLMV